jgi:hypothetical protein
MRKQIFTIGFLIFSFLILNAQVDNYSLKLEPQGSVNFGSIAEINELNTFTVQFWFNPTSWTSGATLFSRGSGNTLFSAKLGNLSGEIIFCAGNNTISVTSSDLTVNKWSQICFISNNGQQKVFVNNTLIKETAIQFTIPTSGDALVLGGNFAGRIDEFRIWNTELNADYYLWRNTINKYHPQWNNLLVYYKFDQNLCPNIVDYKYKHHGIFSATGATREKVTDNTTFKYRINSAYTDFSRFADRGIDKEKYLLANDIIMLGVESFADGTVSIPYPFDQGVISNGNYLASYNGHNGVLALNGNGSKMEVGTKTLTPSSKYSLHTWIYLEEWTEGAFIFKKEASATQGFSIRLGSAATYEIIVRLNGHEYKRNIPTSLITTPVGSWWNLGVVAFSLDLGITKTFMFTFNGKGYFPLSTGVPAVVETTLLPQGVDNTVATVGENLHAKFDETVVWNRDVSEGQITSYMNTNNIPMPGFGKIVDAATTMASMNSYWNYDRIDNPGYDFYSYKYFMSIVRSAYDGYRGQKIRMSVKGHTGWETTFANAAKRKTLAAGIVAAAQEFDGIDLDFEWCYDGTCFNNYGLLLDEIGKIMPAEKIFTVSPHYVSYSFDPKYMANVDYFNFQLYGPSANMFKWSTYLDAYNRFITQGFPKEKILLSYATTTSKAYADIAGATQLAAAPIGVRNGLFDGTYTPDKDVVLDGNGQYRFITGVNQARNRTEFIQDNDLAGIFYWDMGNDVATSHIYSLPKISNFAIASNVDSLVTVVNMNPNGILTSSSNSVSQIRIYPNPVKNQLSVLLPAYEELASISIFNTLGQCQLNSNNSLRNNQISTVKFKAGYYILRAKTLTGNNYSCTFEISN